MFRPEPKGPLSTCPRQINPPLVEKKGESGPEVEVGGGEWGGGFLEGTFFSFWRFGTPPVNESFARGCPSPSKQNNQNSPVGGSTPFHP